jgi:mRNA-degrading endonuclease RelE of RelBE toxin-antitoxin system
VKSRISSDFRRDLDNLPPAVKRQARDAYRLFESDPQHPSLKFKKLPPFADIWSVRINNNYRAVACRRGEVLLWFFIGSHADYDKLLNRI